MRRSGRHGSVSRFGLVIAVGALVAALAVPMGSAAAAPAGAARVKVIVTFKKAPGAAAQRAVNDLGGKVTHTYHLIDGMAMTLPANAVAKMRANKLVNSVELDATVTTLEPVMAAAETGDLEYDNAWGVTHIGSKAVHDAGVWGQGVKVAIIDTGIDYVHNQPPSAEPPVVDAEFNSNYRGGYDFFNNDPDPMDDNGHGTHVAGILAAEKNGYLVVGVAPQVDLYALKILGATGEGDVSNLILALQWAVDHDMDVVNMSVGTHEIAPALATAVANASAAGVLMVAAAGNTVTIQEIFYGCAVTFPGAYPQVLSTTFTNPADALTGYSCTGPEVDFAAPGDNIFSPVPVGSCMICSPNGYLPESGTSMASPHLAGTVALLLSAGLTDAGTPGLFDDVRNRLCATAHLGWGVQTGFGGGTPIPPSDPRYPKYFGCGVVNAQDAVLGLTPPPVNHPPVGNPDDATLAEDTPTDVTVLTNDSDQDGDALAVTSVTDPPHGTTSVNANGTIHYAPDANFVGDDAFAYSIADGHGGTASANVQVHVTAVNDPPTAGADSATTAEDTAVDVAVLANDGDIDGDTLTVTSVGSGLNGTPTINANGTVHFVPSPNYNGAASFQYSVSDGHGGVANGAVQVAVGPVNDAPVAAGDSASTGQGVAVDIAVLVNDTDIDSGSLSVGSVSDPPHGTAVANANGTIRYTPDAGYSGPDAFGYSASDGSASSNTATVSITVTPAPPPTFHVGDLDGAGTNSGKTWTAKVTILVHDANHVALSGVVVTGTWSAGASGSGSCTTGATGTCTLQKTKLARASVGSVTFTVTSATRSGWAYAPALNHDPDPPENGTTIVINRPN